MSQDSTSPISRQWSRTLLRLVWQGRLLPAFWTVTAVLSLTVNIILIAGLILVGKQLFVLKQVINEQLLGQLYWNFMLMDQANIQTTVEVHDRIPVQFDLPVQATTVVVLSEPVRIPDATVVSLRTGGLNITNAPADIVLPAGTELPIELSIVVPVDTSVPVDLIVPVDIPLSQTQLHQPFVGLQEVIGPLYQLLAETPDSWQELLCPPAPNVICQYMDRQRSLPDLLPLP